MLFYLDNQLSTAAHPNENHARELMELHTLGVDNGYTQQDVIEIARCFTGWGLHGFGSSIDYRDILAELLLDRLATPDVGAVLPGFTPTIRNVFS